MFPFDWLDSSHLRGDRSPTRSANTPSSEIWAQGHADYPSLHRLNHAEKVETAQDVKVSYHCVACLRECTATLTPAEIIVLASGARPGPGLGSDVVWEEEPTWSDGTGGGFSPRVLCVCGYDVPSFVVSVEECRETLVRFPSYLEGAEARVLQARAKIAALVPRLRGRLSRVTKAVEPLLDWLSSRAGAAADVPSGPHDEWADFVAPAPPFSPFVGEKAPPSVTTPGDRVRAYQEGMTEQTRLFAKEMDEVAEGLAPGSFRFDVNKGPDLRQTLAHVKKAGWSDGWDEGLDAGRGDASSSLEQHLVELGILPESEGKRSWLDMRKALEAYVAQHAPAPEAPPAPEATEAPATDPNVPAARTHR